jgi:nicotinamidase-related amidase
MVQLTEESGVAEQDELTDLVELALAQRPEQLVDLAVAERVGPENVAEARRALAQVTEVLATLGYATPPSRPSAALRERLLRTVAAKQEALAGAPSRRAVLVLDMLDDHLTPGRPLEVPRAREIVPALVALLDESRAKGTPVVYVCDRHAPDDPDLDVWGTHNVEASEGARVWPAVTPKPGDLVVEKPTYSAFTRSNLGEVLDGLAVDTLVLTGCLTELGMLATATDALQRGYSVEVPRETQAGATAATEQMALSLMTLMAPYGKARQELLARVRQDRQPAAR